MSTNCARDGGWPFAIILLSNDFKTPADRQKLGPNACYLLQQKKAPGEAACAEQGAAAPGIIAALTIRKPSSRTLFIRYYCS